MSDVLILSHFILRSNHHIIIFVTKPHGCMLYFFLETEEAAGMFRRRPLQHSYRREAFIGREEVRHGTTHFVQDAVCRL